MRLVNTVFETRISVPYYWDLDFVEKDSLYLKNQLCLFSDHAYAYLDDASLGQQMIKLEKQEEERLLKRYYSEYEINPIEIYAEIDEIDAEVIDYSVDSLNHYQIEQFLKDYPSFKLETAIVTIDDKSFEKKVFVEKTALEIELDSINEIMMTGEVA